MPIDMIAGRLLPPLHPSPKDLTGKTAIVTGSNVGIGLEAARALATMGATVVLACRNGKKADAARLDIVDNSKGKVRPEQVEVQIIDFGDLQSVRTFVDRWGARPLDILINNAGITAKTFVKSPQGFELTYSTNILSHYLLTLSLLPVMNDGARIVSVASGGNYSIRNQFDTNDLDFSKTLENKYHIKEGSGLPGDIPMTTYSRSKLLQIFFTRELQNRLDDHSKYHAKNITAHVYHPGLVRTSIYTREDGASSENALKFVNALGVSAEQGAATGIHLAISNEAYENKGRYWDRMGLRAPNRLVEDAKTRVAVWQQMAEECELPSDLRL